MYDWEGWPAAPCYDQQGVEDVSEDVWSEYQLLSPSPALPACLPEEVKGVWLPAGARALNVTIELLWPHSDWLGTSFKTWHLTLTCPVPPLMDFSGVSGHNYRVIRLMHKLCRWWSCLWFVFDMIWWLNKFTVVVHWQHLGQ